MAVQLVSLVEVMDKVAADGEAMEDAAQQFNDLLQVNARAFSDFYFDFSFDSGT